MLTIVVPCIVKTDFPFQFGGYEIVADAQNVEKAMVANERVLKGHIVS